MLWRSLTLAIDGEAPMKGRDMELKRQALAIVERAS